MAKRKLATTKLKHLTRAQVDKLIELDTACQRPVEGVGDRSSGIISYTFAELTKAVEARQPEYEAKRDFLRTMSDEAVIELQAVVWFGRGDGTLPQMLRYSYQHHHKFDREYIGGKVLSRMLPWAIERMRPDCFVSKPH